MKKPATAKLMEHCLQRLAADEFRPSAHLPWDTLLPGQLLAHALGEELSSLSVIKMLAHGFVWHFGGMGDDSYLRFHEKGHAEINSVSSHHIVHI